MEQSQVEVVETGSGVSVRQTWTGGDGAMAGTVIVTWIPYANIGKIDLGPPAGKGDHTWTVHVQSANTPFLQKIDSPERKTATRTLPEIHVTTTESSAYFEFANSGLPDVKAIEEAVFPGPSASLYASVDIPRTPPACGYLVAKQTVHRNLYRIPTP